MKVVIIEIKRHLQINGTNAPKRKNRFAASVRGNSGASTAVVVCVCVVLITNITNIIVYYR